MRKMNSARRGLAGCSKKKRLLIILLAMAGLLFLLDCQLRPIVSETAAGQARILSTRAINDAVNEVLSVENVQYEELSTLMQDAEGNIQAAQANMTAMNRLKAEVTSAIQKKFDGSGMSEYSIPVGTLTGSPMLIGRGPGIPLKLQLMGSITSEMESEFVAAGVNQTCHRIVLNLHTQIYAIVPGCQTTISIDSNFIIAESVIVGEVPDTFLQVGSDSSSLLSKMIQESN